MSPAERRSAAIEDTAPLPPAGCGQEPPPRISGWRLLEPLGHGSRSLVYLAQELDGPRIAAVKLFSAHVLHEAATQARIARELRIAGELRHPCIIACLESGCWEGRPYLVLEHAPGGDLRRLIERHRGVPERCALDIAVAVASALTAVHAAGLVHRDVKPGNIFIDGRGGAKLGDLGLVRSCSADDQLTGPGQVLGTPVYMAPEQAYGSERIDIRADIYGLGATLFHLLTGRRPVQGQSLYEIVRRIGEDPVPDPQRYRPGLDPSLCALVRSCMAKDRDLRPCDPRTLCDELRALS